MVVIRQISNLICNKIIKTYSSSNGPNYRRRLCLHALPNDVVPTFPNNIHKDRKPSPSKEIFVFPPTTNPKPQPTAELSIPRVLPKQERKNKPHSSRKTASQKSMRNRIVGLPTEGTDNFATKMMAV